MIVQAVPEAYSSNFNTLYDPAYHNSRLEVIERSSIFSSSNYAVHSLPAPQPDVWRRCFATTDQKSRRFISLRNRAASMHERQIEVHFTDPASGAEELFEIAFRGAMEGEAKEMQETLSHLATALELYQSAVTPPGHTGRGVNCKARLTLSVGPGKRFSRIKLASRMTLICSIYLCTAQTEPNVPSTTLTTSSAE